MSHRPAPPAGARRRKPWQRRLAIGAWIFSGLCILGFLGTVLTVTYGLRQSAGQACCWAENATPEWAARTMGVQVPETATDRRAGLHSNVQYDVALLAFTVPTDEADRLLRPLRSEGSEMARNRYPEKPGYTRGDGFTHLGLPEPETFVEGMRMGSVCPRDAKTPQSESLRLCANVYAHEFQPGTTRIYLWASSEAPIPKPTG
ncbi:hypothetical protein [Streptomyces sp. NBC_00454]|uniref:hypothetical protein n=1 Tax=Streptomyces sp. NBC_00454 TaxID=2975747 RepID=UPI0030E263FD